MKKSPQLIIVILVAFAGAGLIQLASIPINPALAFAIGALLCSIPLYCSLQNSDSKTFIENSASSTVYVGNLPYKANENDVKELFSNYGEVFAVRLMKDKRTGKRRGFGFVVMAVEDAPNAIKKLNNKEYLDRTLKVREANEPKTQDSE